MPESQQIYTRTCRDFQIQWGRYGWYGAEDSGLDEGKSGGPQPPPGWVRGTYLPTPALELAVLPALCLVAVGLLHLSLSLSEIRKSAFWGKGACLLVIWCQCQINSWWTCWMNENPGSMLSSDIFSPLFSFIFLYQYLWSVSTLRTQDIKRTRTICSP